jgi:hypothetical protein
MDGHMHMEQALPKASKKYQIIVEFDPAHVDKAIILTVNDENSTNMNIISGLSVIGLVASLEGYRVSLTNMEMPDVKLVESDSITAPSKGPVGFQPQPSPYL